MVKLDANIEAVILRQSVQLQTKVLTRPGPEVGKESCTAEQKQVAVAVSSFDQPSEARPERGKEDSGEVLLSADMVIWFWMAVRRDVGLLIFSLVVME